MQRLRAAFWFGSDVEIRYVAEPPELGDYVTHNSQLWRVAKVETDELGLNIVCEPPIPESGVSPPLVWRNASN